MRFLFLLFAPVGCRTGHFGREDKGRNYVNASPEKLVKSASVINET